MDAYHHGLNGQQAAWAAKKYRGHRTLPDTIMEELDSLNLMSCCCLDCPICQVKLRFFVLPDFHAVTLHVTDARDVDACG